MNQPKSPDDNQASSPEPGIRQEADNSTFGSGQQAAIGNDNIQNQGNNNWLGNTWNVFFGQQTTTPVGNPARPKNEWILLASVKEEVTARLRQSLHNAVLINLGKESQPQQVKRPWDAEIKIGLKPAQPLPDTTTILEVFDSEEIAGKLLILGAPGSGKTTTQLELAQALVSRAEEQPDYPVPVLFNLSSWKDDRQSLTDWLVAELKSKYGVSIKLGKDWLDNHQLLLLLDGLDELEPQRQELCVWAINQFLAGETRPLYLVVCSRIEEYSNYATQLQLNGAIYLQSLTNNQICDYLTSINYVELWSTISNDLDLLELVKTPLLLSIIVLASQEISVEQWQYLESTADRIQYLLDAYVGRMLTRDINSRAYLKSKTPNAKQTRMWLVWLAQKMQRDSKTEFLIEEMQPSLLKTKIPKIIYNLIVWGVIQTLIFGMIFALLFGLDNGIFIGVISGIVSGILFGIIHGTSSDLIEHTLENLSLIRSKKIFKINIQKMLVSGICGGLLYRLIFRVYETLLYGFIVLLGVIVVWFINGLFGDILESKFQNVGLIEFKNFTNRNIIKWLIYGLIIGFIGGLIGGLIYGLFGGLLGGLIFGLIGALIGGLTGDEIEAIEIFKISYNDFKDGLIFGLIAGQFFGLFGGLLGGLIFGLFGGLFDESLKGEQISLIIFGLSFGPTFGLFLGLIFGLFFGLLFGLIFGFHGLEIQNKTIPNQGILESAKNTVKLSALLSFTSTLLIFLIQLILEKNSLNEALFSSLVYGLLLGLLVGTPRSGTPLIKHFTLRLILYRNGYIPWNYARFLDYCTERLFLQRVGGRYRFIHKLLQDHFAQMEFKRN
ncbi:NACHT domain-containing protein [Nostoc sp. UHCC 0870]|uniref:NACHT domain-containing protein n=1 Tax=Nostoc sp. UHCC 0870 TaxID=2914041 RepID=UPI001EDF5938|nr:NACHT domain-containing protein [Nostoc sp. UHCC 0870]UKP01465.1 NACHT domain-containing protein [Nostoc sp. UHCC 0870]